MRAVATHLTEEGGALSCAAVWSVHHLSYLARLDEVAPLVSTFVPAWSLQVIDYAHGHWAAVTAFTAIDRCAAALGQLLPPKDWGRTYSLSDLNPRKAEKVRPLADFPLLDRWASSANADPEYHLVAGYRHPMVHRSIGATAELDGSTRSELRVKIDGKETRTRANDLVNRANRLAKCWVGRFLELALDPGFPVGAPPVPVPTP